MNNVKVDILKGSDKPKLYQFFLPHNKEQITETGNVLLWERLPVVIPARYLSLMQHRFYPQILLRSYRAHQIYFNEIGLS